MPSISLSSAPVTVTVWALFQLAGVKVRLAGETVPSVISLLATGIVTFAVGWLLSTTVKVAVPPDSVVVRPLVGLAVIPAGLVFVSANCVVNGVSPFAKLAVT